MCPFPYLQFFGLRSKDHYAQTVFFYGKVRTTTAGSIARAGEGGGEWACVGVDVGVPNVEAKPTAPVFCVL